MIRVSVAFNHRGNAYWFCNLPKRDTRNSTIQPTIYVSNRDNCVSEPIAANSARSFPFGKPKFKFAFEKSAEFPAAFRSRNGTERKRTKLESAVPGTAALAACAPFRSTTRSVSFRRSSAMQDSRGILRRGSACYVTVIRRGSRMVGRGGYGGRDSKKG